MKIISVFVSSLDGKITKGERSPSLWASEEDQEFFKKTLEENKCIVMGSGTFDARYIKSQEGKLRIVLTRNPEQYEKHKVSEQLEFSNENPRELAARLEKAGYTQMLLVAGSQVTTAFFKEKLIDELWLTLEPKMFGKGKQILTEEVEISLQLLEYKKLNEQGTMVLKYIVEK